MEEQVGLRFMLSHGQLITREMSLSQAMEAIDRWLRFARGVPAFLSEKNGVKSYGVDLHHVVYMDIISAADLRQSKQQGPPVVPQPSFGR